MSKNIAKQNQMNLWGKQSDAASSLVLEPQRNDLFLVDLAYAAGQISTVAGLALPKQLPQFVRSISFPEVAIKAEPYRRDSIGFNMPAWDDPVGAVKITFLVDTWDAEEDRCDTVQLLDAWVSLVRAGRGSRRTGYTSFQPGRYFVLDSNYSVQCRFDIYVSLCRGSVPTDMTTTNNVASSNAINVHVYNEQKSQYENVAINLPEALAFLNPPAVPVTAYAPLPTSDMVEHTKWVLRNAWCAGYKLSDLNYSESQAMTLEATFYPDTIERGKLPAINGSPKARYEERKPA